MAKRIVEEAILIDNAKARGGAAVTA